jgi:alpha-L-rhamnosidase
MIMKIGEILVLLVALVAGLPAGAQYIGCKVDSGFAEMPVLRKQFYLTGSTEGVYAVVNSIGYHILNVNGVLVGDKVLQPAVSQLDKHSLSVTYDISSSIRKGRNEIGLWLGQGWGRIYGMPAVVHAVVCREVDGRTDTLLVTDSTWEASPSAITYTGSWQPLQFGGERFDVRYEPLWRPATEVSFPHMRVTPQEFEGNRLLEKLRPRSVQRQTDGSVLVDFGRVVTGQFEVFFFSLPARCEVTMEYLDHLQAEPPHTETDVYVSDGPAGFEFFSNSFHFHSFRYVRIQGLENDSIAPRAYQISAVDPKEGATFECSDPRLNAIHDMVKYTLSCLTFSGYMVDCPHLERMGYGGDGNSSTMTLQTIYDVRSTYYNWLTAWADAMDSTGSLPYVAPAFPTGGGPYWSGFIVKAPWRTYLNYGDRTLIDRHYDQMKRWLAYVERYSPDGLLQPWPDEGRMWFLGDWLAPKGVDVKGESALFVSNCFISECLADMVRMARLTGNEEDAFRFEAWRKRLIADIHRAYYHPETRTYANGTPIDMAYALLADIVLDSATRQMVQDKLIADSWGKYNAHIAVGLMGVPIFTEWAIRERQTDLMATILRQPDYPGYLYMINAQIEEGETYPDLAATPPLDIPPTNRRTPLKRGRGRLPHPDNSQFSIFNSQYTTWESWDGERSHVHNCYNGIGIWFYQALAGIRPDPDEPGYRHFYVDPQPCEGITWVKATKPTLFGDIRVDIEDGRLRVTVPQGTTATVFPGTASERTLSAGEWELELAKYKVKDTINNRNER